MGCINSTKKVSEFRSDNVFRVRATRIQPPTGRSGYLELSPRELVYIVTGREPIVWALQHLRRYGLNGDVFIIEAGRRCMSGPGVFTFRCHCQAERLYQLFQRYVNAVSSEAFIFPEREQHTHPSHILGRPEANPHTNNYLEPAPAAALITRPTAAATTAVTTTAPSAMAESFSSSPLSLDLDTPDSLPSLTLANEIALLNSQLTQPSTPGTYVNTSTASGNLYMEYPLRSQLLEFNNNHTPTASAGGGGGVGGGSGSVPASAFSTLNKKPILKNCSLDVPPEESAPIIRNIENALHLYANVEGLGSKDSEKHLSEASSDRCYENLDGLLNLSLLMQSPPQRQANAILTSTAPINEEDNLTADKDFDEEAELKQTEPTTPVSPSGGMNYIVLDLDHQRKTAPRARRTRFGSRLSLTMDRSDGTGDLPMSLPLSSTSTKSATSITAGSTPRRPDVTKNFNMASSQPLTEESTLGYSTIDFIKTYALIKSSTSDENDLENDDDVDQDQEESRITRHSKCVRKAYSISE